MAYQMTTQEKDRRQGYKERKAGYYDKWYRYNRMDDGAAYDDGVKMAIDEMGDNIPECNMIECKSF